MVNYFRAGLSKSSKPKLLEINSARAETHRLVSILQRSNIPRFSGVWRDDDGDAANEFYVASNGGFVPIMYSKLAPAAVSYYDFFSQHSEL